MTEAGKRLLSQVLGKRIAPGSIAAIEAEATAAAEQRLRSAEIVVEAARAAWMAAYFTGPEVGDLEVALAAYDSDAPAPREPEYPQPGCSCEPCQRPASPRQGEPVDVDPRHRGYREGRAAVLQELVEYLHERLDVADRIVAESDGPLPTADEVRGIAAEYAALSEPAEAET